MSAPFVAVRRSYLGFDPRPCGCKVRSTRWLVGVGQCGSSRCGATWVIVGQCGSSRCGATWVIAGSPAR